MGGGNQGAKPQMRTRGVCFFICSCLLHKGDLSCSAALPAHHLHCWGTESLHWRCSSVPVPAHHWSGLVSRHSLKANEKGGLAVSPQPGLNVAFIINHKSNLFCWQNEQYISNKTTDLLEHLYEHKTLNPISKMAEINPMQHDMRKVKRWNVIVKLEWVNLWSQKLTDPWMLLLSVHGTAKTVLLP